MAGNQAGRRRAPKPVPGLATIADRALQDTELPDNTKEQFRTLFRRLEQYLRTQNQGSYLGFPVPHASTHQPDEDDEFIHGSNHSPDGTDPITTAAPSGKQFDDDPEEGEEDSFARSDHVHTSPRADQVGSSFEQKTLMRDLQWVATKDPWALVYASNTFK